MKETKRNQSKERNEMKEKEMKENIIITTIISTFNENDVEVLEKRLSSERAEFDEFYENKGYDYLVRNVSSLDYLYGQVDAVMESLGFEKLSR